MTIRRSTLCAHAILGLALVAPSVLLAQTPRPPATPPQVPVATPGELRTGGFTFNYVLTLPGRPEQVFDAVTGDISGWWDHKFSPRPVRFVIEPKPGGGFWEIFDEAGNGVLHATVIYAERGKRLRFDGPLGLTGHAVQMVHTFDFAPAAGDSTRVTLTVRAAGEMQEGWPLVVSGVWRHFLFGRLRPWVEAGRHLRRP